MYRHSGWLPSMALSVDTVKLEIKAILALSNQSLVRIITTLNICVLLPMTVQEIRHVTDVAANS